MSDAFQNGLMWVVYTDLEKNLQNFLEYVPFISVHRKVYSQKLLQLMLQIGGYVDTAFKEMAKYHSFDGNEKCALIRTKTEAGETVKISLAREAFEPVYNLSSRTLFAKSPQYLRRILVDRRRPFSDFRLGKSPSWWKAYNKIKHDWLTNIAEANLSNTLDALAAAFLLNVIHEPGLISLASAGLVMDGFSEERIDVLMIDHILAGNTGLRCFRLNVETPLFLWNCSSANFTPKHQKQLES